MSEVVVVEATSASVLRDELWPLYRDIFGDFDDFEQWHEQVWVRHSTKAGFRIALARTGGRLVGFAYGYTGAHGQWWTDTAATLLHPGVASDWLGGHFELVSLGVDEAVRGTGIGRDLLSGVTEGLPQARWLLMASADPTDPARRLYRSSGWAVIGPGFSEDRIIMGRSLPVCPTADRGGFESAIDTRSPLSSKG